MFPCHLEPLLSSRPGFPALVFDKWPRYAGVGGAVGILTASAMMYMKMKTIDLGGLEDRHVKDVSEGYRI